MQIFVINLEGKILTLDVEPQDIIKTVKMKLQVKISVPHHLYRLTFNAKLLMDDKSLDYYNIQKDSNLQTWYCATVPKDLEVEGPAVDWVKVANSAKSKVDEEVGEKKAVYENLLKIKREVVGKANKIKTEIKQIENAEFKAGQHILLKEGEIRVREMRILEINEELKEAREEIQVSKRGTVFMINQRMTRRNELDGLQTRIQKLDDEMKKTFIVSGDRNKRNKELEKVNKEKLALKKFLDKTIAEKETLLECPVCYQAASPPIYKCAKEHLICSRCLPRVKSKCPTCRAGFNNDEMIFRLAEENYRELLKLKDKLKEFSALTEHIGGTRLFSCSSCDTVVTSREELISTGFQGATGRAFLFNKVVNLKSSEVMDRVMVTGHHLVRDVFCKTCDAKLGWLYELATEDKQKYKEGKIILERALVKECDGIDNLPVSD